MSALSAPPPLPPDEVPVGERPKIGEWNHLEACVGQRGMGKSTFQCSRALELSREAGGAYVIGHSLGARLPKSLPTDLGGETLPITYHSTLRQLESGLRAHPDRWHILAPPLAGDGARLPDGKDPETADDLIKFSLRLSTAVRQAAWKSEHTFGIWNPPKTDATGTPCVPIIVIIDEGIAVEAASTGSRGRSGNDRWFLQYLYSLRHNHIALLYAIQDATARSWRVLEQATAIHAFHIRHEWAVQAIRAAGATEAQADMLPTLPKFQHITIE